MRWVLALFLLAVATSGACHAASPRLALIIANSDYNGDGRIDVGIPAAVSPSSDYAPDLRNPLNDGRAIRDVLDQAGYTVKLVPNADAATMLVALAEFGDALRAAGPQTQAVIYFAGHALQINGVNYLVPVGAKLPKIDFATMRAPEVQAALAQAFVAADELINTFQTPSGGGFNVLVLDACRNNPWSGVVAMTGRSLPGAATPSSGAFVGLARMNATKPRTLIAFSTSPNNVALDGEGQLSPFAAAFAQRASRPATLLQFFDGVGDDVQKSTNGRQTPWVQNPSLGRACLFFCPRFDVVLPPETLQMCQSISTVWRDLRAGRVPGSDRFGKVFERQFIGTKYLRRGDALGYTFATAEAPGDIYLETMFEGASQAQVQTWLVNCFQTFEADPNAIGGDVLAVNADGTRAFMETRSHSLDIGSGRSIQEYIAAERRTVVGATVWIMVDKR